MKLTNWPSIYHRKEVMFSCRFVCLLVSFEKLLIFWGDFGKCKYKKVYNFNVGDGHVYKFTTSVFWNPDVVHVCTDLRHDVSM